MKDFTNGDELREHFRYTNPKTVRVEVAIEVLADLMGRKFRADDGSTISIDYVRVGWSPSWGCYEAEPVFTRQEPPSSWGDEAARIRRQFLDPIEKPRSLMDILGDLGI